MLSKKLGKKGTTRTVPNDFKHIRNDGSEYWSARELAPVLDYAKWENFQKTISRAMIACENSGHSVSDDFPEVRKIVEAGATFKPKKDYELSRYACYLIVQNGDPRKEVIALGQTYFAIQTYRQELANLFRISQTEEKLRKDNIQGADKATQTHYAVGREVRKAIEKIGGTMPEDLPTPEKSIQQIEKEQMERLQKKAKAGKLMLDE